MSKEKFEILERTVHAVNNGDAERFLHCFSRTAIVRDWGLVFQGLDQIRDWSDCELFNTRSKLSILSAALEIAKLNVKLRWESTLYRGESNFSFAFDSDRISEMSIVD